MTTLHHIWQSSHASDFAAGVRLLQEHNPSAVSKNTLRRLQHLAITGGFVSDYERGKLAEALQKITVGGIQTAPSPQEKPNEKPPVTPEKITIENPRTGEPDVSITAERLQEAFDSMPAENTLISDRARALHKAHSRAHALMTAAKTDEERAQYAREIMEDIVPALDAEYDRLRAEAAKSTGDSESPVDSDAPTGPIINAGDAKAFKKLQSVRSRISTLKKNIKAEKDPVKKNKWEKELHGKTAERDRMEKELA